MNHPHASPPPPPPNWNYYHRKCHCINPPHCDLDLKKKKKEKNKHHIHKKWEFMSMMNNSHLILHSLPEIKGKDEIIWLRDHWNSNTTLVLSLLRLPLPVKCTPHPTLAEGDSYPCIWPTLRSASVWRWVHLTVITTMLLIIQKAAMSNGNALHTFS